MNGGVDVLMSRAAEAGGLLVRELQQFLTGVVPAGPVGAKAEPASRWMAVTVNRPIDQVSVDALPEPLASLRDRIEVDVRRAPADKGTEIYARLREPLPGGVGAAAARARGEDPRQELRSALRQAKQILEVGEVLQADRPSTTRRTVLNRPLEVATRIAGGEGRL
jgi:uncharacterized membrane protein